MYHTESFLKEILELGKKKKKNKNQQTNQFSHIRFESGIQ